MADDVTRRCAQPLRAAAVALGLAHVLSAAGCDRLPWSSTDEKAPAVASAASTAASPAVPTKPAVLPSDIMANVNNTSITKADVELRVKELQALVEGTGGAWTPLSREQMDAILDELISTELMSQDAVARGLDRSLEVQQRWEYLRRGFFAQAWLQWHQTRIEPTAADIEKYYEDNKLGFREPAQLQLRQLVVSSEDQAKQALAQLLNGTADFGNLAQQISLGPTAAQSGLLPGSVMRANDKALFFAAEADAAAAGVTSLDPVLEAAAFAIDKVNGFSNYVTGADGRYHIFQLVTRQEERQREKSDVWDAIKNFLQTQQLQQAVEALRGKASIERFTERLESLAP